VINDCIGYIGIIKDKKGKLRIMKDEKRIIRKNKDKISDFYDLFEVKINILYLA